MQLIRLKLVVFIKRYCDIFTRFESNFNRSAKAEVEFERARKKYLFNLSPFFLFRFSFPSCARDRRQLFRASIYRNETNGSIELGGTRNSVDSTAERNGNLAGKVIQNSLCTRNTISAASGDCNAHSNARREAVRHARVGWACVRDGQGVSSFLPRSYFLFFSTCTPHARPFPPEKGAPPVLRHTQVFLSERRGEAGTHQQLSTPATG